jgi:hypothetical protein
MMLKVPCCCKKNNLGGRAPWHRKRLSLPAVELRARINRQLSSHARRRSPSRRPHRSPILQPISQSRPSSSLPPSERGEERSNHPRPRRRNRCSPSPAGRGRCALHLLGSSHPTAAKSFDWIRLTRLPAKHLLHPPQAGPIAIVGIVIPRDRGCRRCGFPRRLG